MRLGCGVIVMSIWVQRSHCDSLPPGVFGVQAVGEERQG